MNTIGQFKGEYRFLSNFYPASFVWRGFTWASSENAYQAAKSVDVSDWRALQNLTPGEAKRRGRSVVIRGDWETIKFSIMCEILVAKFKQNPHLGDALKATGLAHLEEGNTWGDQTWGVCPPGSIGGKNLLGLALMAVRASL